MALGDYILCSKCECKLIYDGHGTQREWWEDRWGKPPSIQCPDCAASAPVSYHRDDEGSEAAESYAKLMAQLDDKGRRTLANLVAHGAKAVLAPDGAVVLTRSDWAELRILRAASAPAVPQGWKMVPLEPTEAMVAAYWQSKTSAGAWAAMLAASPQVAVPAPQPSLIADAARVIEWARSKPRKPAQSAFTDGPERQAAYWIEWAEGTAPQPSVEKEREAFLAYCRTKNLPLHWISSAERYEGWLARASLGGSNGR